MKRRQLRLDGIAPGAVMLFSQRWRLKMIRYFPVICVVLPLSLAGCETATTALATLGIQGITLGGQYLVESAAEDIAEAREWRGKHKALMAVIEAACIQGASAKMAQGGWDAAKADFDECLSLSVDNQPQILVERLRDRVARAKASQVAAVGDEEGGGTTMPATPTETAPAALAPATATGSRP